MVCASDGWSAAREWFYRQAHRLRAQPRTSKRKMKECLGEVGPQRLFRRPEFFTDRGQASDYNEVDEPMGALIQRARDEGKSFSSFWRHAGKVIRIATNQTRCVTTAYLVGED
jgi:hypothetical protein